MIALAIGEKDEEDMVFCKSRIRKAIIYYFVPWLDLSLSSPSFSQITFSTEKGDYEPFHI